MGVKSPFFKDILIEYMEDYITVYTFFSEWIGMILSLSWKAGVS
jgi:hypothetical protein